MWFPVFYAYSLPVQFVNPCCCSLLCFCYFVFLRKCVLSLECVRKHEMIVYSLFRLSLSLDQFSPFRIYAIQLYKSLYNLDLSSVLHVKLLHSNCSVNNNNNYIDRQTHARTHAQHVITHSFGGVYLFRNFHRWNLRLFWTRAGRYDFIIRCFGNANT